MDEETKKQVVKMIDEAVNKYARFNNRKIGDTPTDDNQLTPRGYVNLSGVRADRPSSPVQGQQFFSTQDRYPWFYDGVASWVSATGSTVGGL